MILFNGPQLVEHKKSPQKITSKIISNLLNEIGFFAVKEGWPPPEEQLPISHKQKDE